MYAVRQHLTQRFGRAGRDRGGVALIVAVVAGCGLLMGAGALVVDLGAMHAEREQLQSGADAAATKLAQTCAKNVADCGEAVGRGLAQPYANANSNDGTSDVAVICGRGGSLPACTGVATNTLADCVKVAPASGNYVEVRTSTRTGNSTLLPPAFAGALLPGYQGRNLRVCARAAWGAASRSTGISATISVCEWDSFTSGGTVFPNPPTDLAIRLHDVKNTTRCPAGPAGTDVPGGFGWLRETAGPCKTTVGVDGTYLGNPGNNVSQDCQHLLPTLRSTAQTLLMPVYYKVVDAGNNSTYTIKGLAGFVITGWRLPGFNAVSLLTGQNYCDKSDTCLYGYFVKGLLPVTGEIGGPDLGASIVTLVG